MALVMSCPDEGHLSWDKGVMFNRILRIFVDTK